MLLCGLLRSQQTARRVGNRLGTITFISQPAHFLPQPRQVFPRPGVKACDALAELERPQGNGGAEPENDGRHGPPQRPGQSAAHRDAGRADGQPSTKELETHDPLAKGSQYRKN